MPHQIVLSWEIDCSQSPLGSAAALAKLDSVPLYLNDTTDPILGQFFGLTVDGDDTTDEGGGIIRRTITLNMDGTNDPAAPPPFACHWRAPFGIAPPYTFRATVPLAGTFTPQLGSTAVATSASQVGTLNVGDIIELVSQQGVPYEVGTIGSSQIGLTTPFTGITGQTIAFEEIDAPAKLVAVYSTSPMDTMTIANVLPPIPNGPGARSVEILYDDSEGNGPFTDSFTLTGKRPKLLELDPSAVDMAVVISMRIDNTGGFGNSVGQITLCELSAVPEVVPPNTPLGTPDNPFEGRSYLSLTDEAQLLITRALVYLPPSYFAMAQQSASLTATVPTNDQLATPLAQFVATETAVPPPITNPATIPAPTFLSGYYTRQLQLALAGLPVRARPITFV